MDWGDYGYGLWTAFMDFELADNCYSLTTDVDPLGSGTVSVDLAENCPDGGYTYGSVVQLTGRTQPGLQVHQVERERLRDMPKQPRSP